jgi:hypothetical protein
VLALKRGPHQPALARICVRICEFAMDGCNLDRIRQASSRLFRRMRGRRRYRCRRRAEILAATAYSQCRSSTANSLCCAASVSSDLSIRQGQPTSVAVSLLPLVVRRIAKDRDRSRRSACSSARPSGNGGVSFRPWRKRARIPWEI